MIDSGLPSAPTNVPSNEAFVSCLDSNDFDGNTDCENGVTGEVKLADMLAAPSVWPNVVSSSAGFEAAANVGSRFAERAIKVSMHFDMMVSSNSPALSSLKCFPAPRANAMLSLYSCRW